MEDILILVDDEDNEIGYNKKMDVHIKGQLHRAFSLFIYDKTQKKLLLHKRAIGKYHSGGLWTNSCCSHPRKGELLINSVIRRTNDELGIDIQEFEKNLIEIGKFHYYKKFKYCAENEIDHVFVLILDVQPILNINHEEVADFKWNSIDEIDSELEEKPHYFTAWFPEAYKIFKNNLVHNN